MSTILPINLDDLLRCRGVESERVEFKAAWNPERTGPQALRAICAFANDYHNLNGGYVVIGVEERDGRAALPPRRSVRHRARSGAAMDSRQLQPDRAALPAHPVARNGRRSDPKSNTVIEGSERLQARSQASDRFRQRREDDSVVVSHPPTKTNRTNREIDGSPLRRPGRCTLETLGVAEMLTYLERRGLVADP